MSTRVVVFREVYHHMPALEKDEVCRLSKREFCLYFGFWILKDCDQQKKNWWVKWWMIWCLKYDISSLSFRGMSTRAVVFREVDHHMPWRRMKCVASRRGSFAFILDSKGLRPTPGQVPSHRSFRSVHHLSFHRSTVSSMFPDWVSDWSFADWVEFEFDFGSWLSKALLD